MYHDAVVVADLVQNFFGWSKVTLFATTDNYGSQSSYRFKDEAAKRGIDILSSHAFLVDTDDLTNEIKSAKAAGASIFVLLVGPSDGLNLLRQGYEQGLFTKNTQIIGGGYLSASSRWDNAGILDHRVAEYMEGFLGVHWMPQVFPSPQVEGFIRRWKSRNSTAGVVQSDGSVKCDDRMDYYNLVYLHQFQPYGNASAPPVCAGVNFSSYADDGSDLIEAMYAYDAVMAIARALHHIAYVEGVCDPAPGDVLRHLQDNVHFEGLSGNVSFSTKFRRQFFDVGGRDTSVAYEVVNYVPGSSLPNGRGSVVFKDVIGWHSEQGFESCDGYVTYNSKCHDFQFRTGGNKLPLDSPPPTILFMPPYFRVIMWFFALVCLLLVLTVLIVVTFFHGRRICRMAQPSMIILTCLGVIFACVRVILAAVDISEVSCFCEFWMGHLAFIVVVTTLGIKTWRVYMVTNALKKVKIAESKCTAIVLGVIGMASMVMAVHSTIGDIHVAKVILVHDQFEYEKELKCVSENDDALYALYAVEVLLILFAGRMMWCTRHVASTISSTGTSATGKHFIRLRHVHI